MKFLAVLFMLVSTLLHSQQGFGLADGKKATIPFKFINNLIFIPVQINGVDLTFLLDSGVNETILFSLDEREVNFNDIEKIKFSGLGETKNIEGLRSDNNTMTIGKGFSDPKHTVFIILDESINFSSHVGIPVHGIIGYQFFANHAVQIDFMAKKLTVFPKSTSSAGKFKKFTEFPLSIEGNKPYITAGIEQKDEKRDSKMLIDLGNSDAVWLFPKLIDNFVYNRPNIYDYLGQGFNGDIFGKRSRIHRLYLGEFTFEKPIAAMPDEYSIQNLKLVPDRKGSVGSEILRRFTVIFDYPGSRILLKKNRHFNDLFQINKSGLDIQHDGATWESDLVRVETTKKDSDPDGIKVYDAREGFRYNFVLRPKYSVAGCRNDSPCSEAGLLKGDKLLRINNQKVGNMTLPQINQLLKAPDGTRLTLKIDRKGQQFDFSIKLIDPIPYQDEN